ncbi:MAG: Gfo/Idh/MocA family oxidoreductase [Candidatus Margulisiibacteriota bacterium]|nr:Gfo/Idh/MocA family oxidoreductase [Candidatus Margulisiibacteriota bacterium]
MKNLNYCIIGAGRWGKNHIRTADELGVLSGIIESNKSAQDELKKQYPNVNIHSSLRDAGALDYDAYSVVVPAEHHYSVAKTLIEHKKHVLIEKPITTNSKESNELVKLAKANNVIVCVGHLLLFHNAFLKMKALIDAGKIGKVQYIYSNRLNLGTVRTEENSLWSFAPHDISLFQYFTGSYPEKVNSTGGAFLQPHIHDTTMTVLEYPNNVKGHIYVSWLHPFKEHRFVIVGSKGMFMYEDSSDEKSLLFYEKGIDFVNGEPVKRDGPTEVIEYEKAPALKEEIAHFIECISNQTFDSRISAAAGSDVLEILELAQQSLESGQAVNVNEKSQPKETSQKNVFVHDTAVVDEPCSIGENTKIWHYSHVQQNATIGKNCILGQNVNIACNVKVGNYAKIQNNVSLYEGVELEDYVFCGPSMVFTNIKNPRCKYPQAESKFYIKTLVKEGATFGANCTVVCGITVGRFAFIGAGAVVTKNVPDFAIIVGNPGKIVGWMSEGGVRLDFDANNEAFCEKSQKAYVFDGEKVIEKQVNTVKQ